MDMELEGITYTWSNRRTGVDLIHVLKLDITLLSFDWISKFSCILSYSLRIGFDHFPIVFKANTPNGKNNIPFYFENMWLAHPSLKGCIAKWWNYN